MLNVLILEDQATDVKRILDELRRAGFEPAYQCVTTQADYLTHLYSDLDIILAACNPHLFTALDALHLLQERGLDIPYIVVSGGTNEEIAVECVKQGAADYIPKDQLDRLGESVRVALNNKRQWEERSQTQMLYRLSRAYKTLSACDQAMARSTDEAEFLQKVCQIITEIGGYRMSWVGFAEQDKNKTVRPMTWSGHEADYLQSVEITWADDGQGRGPTGTAIRTGKPSVMRYIESDPAYKPWRAEALKRGYASSIALPLFDGERVLGALNIYSEKPDAFDTFEIDLLQKLAGNLTYGITTLRALAERKLAEIEAQTISLISQVFLSSDNTLETVYRELPKVLSTNFQFPIVAIELYDQAAKEMAFTGFTGIHLDGSLPLRVPADQTLSGVVATTGKAVVELNASQRSEYQSQALKKLNVETFLCVPLRIEGRVLGTLALADGYRQPNTIPRIETLQIIANYLAQEIQRKQAGDALHESEEKYHQLFEMVSDATFLIDSETGQILEVNRAASTLYGYSREELLQKKNTDLSAEPDQTRRAVQTHAAHVPIRFHRKKNGTIFPIEISASHFVWHGRQVHIAAVRDITERRRSEEALRYQANLLNQVSEAIIAFDPETRIRSWNKAAESIYGWRAEEAIGQSAYEIFQTEYKNQSGEQVAEQLWKEGRWSGEIIQRRKDGTPVEIQALASVIRNEDGNVTGMVSANRDITEQKRVEQAEYEQRTLAEALSRTAAILTSTLDLDGVMKQILTAVRQVVPHDAANIMLVEGNAARLASWVGYQIEQPYPEGSVFPLEVLLRDGMAVGVPTVIPDTALYPYWVDVPETQWIRSHVATPIRIHDRIIGFLNLDSRTPNFFTQAHARRLQAFADQAAVAVQNAQLFRQAQKRADYLVALNEASHRVSRWGLDLDGVLQAIVESVVENVGVAFARIWLTDESGSYLVLRASAGLYTHLDGSRSRVKIAEDRTKLGELARECKPLVINNILEDERFDQGWAREQALVSFAGYPLRKDDQLMAVLVIFSRQTLDQSLLDMLGSFASQVAIAIQNALLYRELEVYSEVLERAIDERTAELSQAKEHAEAILNSSSDIIILAGPDGKIRQTNAMFNRVFNCRAGEFLGQQLGILAAPSYVPLLAEVLNTVVENKQPGRLEMTIRKNQVSFEADVALSPIVEQEGQTIGVVCSLRDITTRKELETRLRQTLEAEIELNELKSRFVSMASHEFRTPLAVIQTSIDLLLRYTDRISEEQKQQEFDHIRASIKHMVQLLDDVLVISRAEAGKLRFSPEQTDLKAFCQGILAEFQQASSATHHIVFSAIGECTNVMADPRLLRHIVENLLSNAIKYSPVGSTVTIGLACETDRAVLRITDEGIGIPEVDQARLFEVFHRAANVGTIPGTGLGLAIVKQSVDLHEGTITFESREGYGTTFTVTIPYVFRGEADQ